MRLVLTELDRYFSRRAIALMLVGGLLLTALLVATAIWDTRPATDGEVAAAESQAATAAADPRLQREQEQCLEKPQDFFGPDATAAFCDRLTPRVDDFLPRNTLEVERMVENRGVVEVILVAALLVICGVTFAGGDWATGSVANQLLFRPRRAQVWLAKAVAVLVASALAGAVLMTAFWGALLLTSQARGISTPGEVYADIVWMSVRGVTLAAAGALGGYALTMLLRSTLGSMAVLFAAVVLGEALVMTLPLEKASQWSLANNVLAWINGGTSVFDTDIACEPGFGGCDQSYLLGIGHGATYLGVVLALALVLSVLSFRRRDVG
jgi:ABC-2 type transport system permease protein